MAGIIAKLNDVRRNEGISGFARILAYRLSEAWHDRRFNIQTPRRRIPLETFGLANPDYVFYEPTPYAAIFAAISGLEITSKDAFLDLGCGMGRVMVVASTKPFGRVLGVELVQSFIDEAHKNLERAKASRRCEAIEITQADVVDFTIPDDVTVAHFFNPFRGRTLQTVIGHLKDSLERVPRRVTVLFANPFSFEEVIADNDWIRFRAEKPWPRRPPGSEDGHNTYRIYEASLPAQGVVCK